MHVFVEAGARHELEPETGGPLEDDATRSRDLKPFLALEAATLIANIGNGVAAIALPWLTLQMTGNPAAAGIVVAAGALPALIASLGSGVIIDRLGRQRTSVGSDVVSATSAAMIPVFGLLGILSFPLVLIASALGAVFDPVGVTAREAMLPDVAKRARLKLERVNGINEAVWGLAWLIGPGLAGVLIGSIGAVNAFWAMCAGFVVSAVLVATACMPTPAPRTAERQLWLSEAMDGLRLVVREPAIRSTTVLSTMAFTVGYSVLAVVLPVVYERLDEPELLGALLMAFSAGGIAGALLYGALGTRVSRRPVFVVGLIATVALPGILALTPGYLVQLALMVVCGFLSGPIGPITSVVLQERVAEEIRGRALSMAFAFGYLLFPIGYVASGFTINAVGVPATLAAMAVISALAALWSMVTPALRGMRPPAEGVST